MDAALYGAVRDFLTWRWRLRGVRSMEFTQIELARFVEALPPERAPELFVEPDRLVRAIQTAREAGELVVEAGEAPRLHIPRLRPPWDQDDARGDGWASPIE
jgi:hypothetical protein